MLSCNWEEKFNQIDRRKPFKICSTAQRDERDGDFFTSYYPYVQIKKHEIENLYGFHAFAQLFGSI